MLDFFSRDSLNENQLNQLPPLVLAYVGDAVYEVFVRAFLVQKGGLLVNKLHRSAIDFVSAKSQAQIVVAVSEFLTDDEKYVLKRGRNAKSATAPKNTDIADYKAATGLEALFGYIYLKKDYDRLMYIINKIIEFKEGETQKNNG